MLDADLFFDLAEKRFFQALPRIDSTLRELPRAAQAGTLRHEHVVFHIKENRRHVRTIEHGPGIGNRLNRRRGYRL